MISWLSKILFYNILGWKFKGTIPDDKKIIAIMGPHTSAYDFIICVIGRSVLNMGNRIKFLGKAELFKNPLYKYFFTAFGGYPVDRSKKNNLVDSIVDIYNSKDEFFVTIAPEGTRKKVDKLKTGFYYIALKAKIPILMIGLNDLLITMKKGCLCALCGAIPTPIMNILKYFGEEMKNDMVKEN